MTNDTGTPNGPSDKPPVRHGLKEVRLGYGGELRTCLCGLGFFGDPDDNRTALERHVESATAQCPAAGEGGESR